MFDLLHEYRFWDNFVQYIFIVSFVRRRISILRNNKLKIWIVFCLLSSDKSEQSCISFCYLFKVWNKQEIFLLLFSVVPSKSTLSCQFEIFCFLLLQVYHTYFFFIISVNFFSTSVNKILSFSISLLYLSTGHLQAFPCFYLFLLNLNSISISIILLISLVKYSISSSIILLTTIHFHFHQVPSSWNNLAFLQTFFSWLKILYLPE